MAITSSKTPCLTVPWLLLAAHCTPVDRCVESNDEASLAEKVPGEDGKTYGDAVELLTGTYQKRIRWSGGGPWERDGFSFDGSNTTTVTIDVRHGGDPIRRNRWRAVEGAEAARCPLPTHTTELAIEVSTEDGALDETFDWTWQFLEPTEEVRIRDSMKEPDGTLRVQSDVPKGASSGYTVAFEVLDGELTTFSVEYWISRTSSNDGDRGGIYWSANLLDDDAPEDGGAPPAKDAGP